MNIIFFGSSDFAIPALRALVNSAHQVICVVSQPDRQRGRGLNLGPTAAKVEAKGLGLKIYQPAQINSLAAEQFLKELKPDLFVVVAYGQILSQRILDIPRVFALNVHASLLPKHRGAAPVSWAIIRGESVSGVTIIKMTDQMDAGPILLQKSMVIEKNDTSVTLERKLSSLGAELLLESLRRIEKNDYRLTAQREDSITYAPRLLKKDGQIDWEASAQDIYNQIRGCLVWPGAFTYYRGKLFKIFSAEFCAGQTLGGEYGPGEIIGVQTEGIMVAAYGGCLSIKELQVEGKRKMTCSEFIAGHKIVPGEKFFKK